MPLVNPLLKPSRGHLHWHIIHIVICGLLVNHCANRSAHLSVPFAVNFVVSSASDICQFVQESHGLVVTDFVGEGRWFMAPAVKLSTSTNGHM